MNKKEFKFSFEEYDNVDYLNDEDASLLRDARKVTEHAYAPYSNFQVGAMARLLNGEKVAGTNQENASYPVGICAERVLLSTVSSLFPKMPIHTLAISYNNLNGQSNRPISPCGICRQTICEYQERVNHPIRLILGGMEGKVYVIENAGILLPLGFSGNDLG